MTKPATSSLFPGSEPLIMAAVQDLAQRLDTDSDNIAVESAQIVVWPDSSLGCPRPDMVYTQVQREGFRILLSVDKTVYAYHGGEGRGPFLCEEPGDDALLPPPGLGDD